MKTWSKIKKRLEGFTCDSLKGRVEFHVANYRRAHDNAGRAYIVVDKKEVMNMCTLRRNVSVYEKEKQMLKDYNVGVEPYDFDSYSPELMSLHYKNYSKVEKEGILSQDDFFEAVEIFLASFIEESLKSENIIIKILSVIDRRVGKRTLVNMRSSIINEHEAIQYFYKLRCDSEKID
ncbi:MAG: hypothetical protein Q8936_06195 [Bacillota bacterium]|nr:hypothetical protein [Bacillota bacterium]